MKCITCDSNKKFDESIFNDIETKFNIFIRNEIKEFIKINAGRPIKKYIDVKGEKYEIRVFLSADKEDMYYCIEKPINYFIERTKGKIVPIGIDSGDNYYCINNENGKIYYWCASDNEFYCIAMSLEEFISMF